MISFLFHQAPGIGIGLVVGCFIPSVLRKVHSFISEYAGKGASFISAEVGKIEKKL